MSLFTTPFTVFPHERALEYVDGVCTRVLGPGRHQAVRRATYRRVEVLDRLVTTAPQEVLTADGVAVRVTAAVRWRVVDPRAFVERVLDPAAVVYLAVQVALRDALVAVEVERLVRDARRLAGAALLEAARAAGAPVGVEVVDVVVKDVVLPPELRAAYAELVTSRTRGLAQLEAARAETAALRSLANGAKLLEEHPALARLRLVQALPYGSKLELSVSE
ncbi:slipin family protein [Nocardioides anomalus]|uniref:Slipin family protein n=1 Tax=Nocardioides anomalus TaxID=2712223 RepID=A0A6G6W9Q0_9ACTN|nr:SPFH domain-containing protein [Nocardioides anomalus]QIG41946.1 slipin family protein [Nocardioides anomalus]